MGRERRASRLLARLSGRSARVDVRGHPLAVAGVLDAADAAAGGVVSEIEIPDYSDLYWGLPREAVSDALPGWPARGR